MSHPWRKIMEVTMECDLGDGVARHTTWAADRETAEWEWRRDYGVAAAMLHELGIGKVRLITNNPEKCTALSERGIEISERVGLPAAVTPENRRYLESKRDRAGHCQNS